MTQGKQASSGARPPSRITILRAPGRSLAKRYEPGPKGVVKRPYDRAKRFLTQEVEISDLAGLEAVLQDLQGRPDCCVVNAAPSSWNPGTRELHLRRVHRTVELVDDRGRFHPLETDPRRREWQKGEEAAGRLWRVTVLETLVERPIGILFLDFEKITLPAGIDWRADLGYTAAFLRLRLPAEFHGAACVHYATASAADLSKADLGGDEVRMRLCFLLDRAVMPAGLKRWLKGVEGLDASTLNAGQPIYTAAPLFGGGLRDPIPERLGVLAGTDQRVAVPVLGEDAYRPSSGPRRGASSTSGTFGAEGLGLLPSPKLDRALALLAAQDGAAGAVRKLLTHAILCYVEDVGRDRVDVEALARALAEAASPWRTPEEIAAYGLPALILWCLPRQEGTEEAPEEESDEPPKPHHANRGMPVAAATKLLKETVADWLSRSVEWLAARPAEPDLTLPDPPVFGVKGAAGLGKSREVARQLADLPGIESMNVAIFISDHRLMEEVLAIYRSILPANVVVQLIKGRGDAKKPEEALCDKIEITEAVAKAKRSVTAHVCGNVYAAIDAHQKSEKTGKTSSRKIKACEFAATCRYFQQFRKKAPAVRIMPHSMMFVKHDKLMPEPDLVIIDESFWQNAISTPMLPLDRLTEEGRWKDGPSMSLHEGKKLVDLRMIARHYGPKVEEALLDGADPRPLVTRDTCLDLARFERGNIAELEINPRQSLEVQLSITKGWKPNEAGLVASFWQGLADEHDHPDRPLQSTQLLRDVGTPDGSRRHTIRTHRRKELHLPKVPVLLLDADLDERINRKLFPSMKFVDIPVKQSATVFQIIDRAGTMRFVMSREEASEADQQSARNRRAELAAFVRREIGPGKRGLLVTFKDLLPELDLPEHVDTLHLGHLRGRDGYKDHDAVVVAGRLEPSPFEIERQARALFFDDPEPLKLIQPDATGRVRYESRMRRYRVTPGPDGNDAGPAVRVSVHPDDRCQALLEQVRECEVTQAVARLRLVHRTKPAVVYVLSNLPLDLEVTRLTTWNELVADKAAEACHRWGGVWPFSPSEQSRLAPDLWPTPKAAERWGEKRGGNNPPKPYKTTFIGLGGVIHPDPPPYPAWGCVPSAREAVTLVSYRFAAQRGSHPHRAYVPGDVSDAARAALEAIVGTVAKIEIVGTLFLVADEAPSDPPDEHPDQTDEQPRPPDAPTEDAAMPEPLDIPFPSGRPTDRWLITAAFVTSSSAPGPGREHLIVHHGREPPGVPPRWRPSFTFGDDG